ncbi:MAG: diguanylate cyclase [Treponema sp.]|jgi:diguanylate cyclase (GGDEF)-like protein|nr:diguanylate cyclase [Treponema sp.]
MKSLLWTAVDLIELVILAFMYSNITRAGKNLSRKLFGYLLIALMSYTIIDMGMYLIQETVFPAARILNYTFSMLFLLIIPLVGFIFLLYCDCKVYNGAPGIKKRAVYYFIPSAVNALAVLSSPFTHIIFYIDAHNMYVRGGFFWIMPLMAFVYAAASYPLLAVKGRTKPALAPSGADIYLSLFQIPPVVLAVIQLMNYEMLLLGMGFLISAFFLFINNVESAEDKLSLSERFRKINSAQFAVIGFIMTVGTLYMINNITDEVSQDYAAYNSSAIAGILETYLNKEIGVLETAAYSKTMIEWFCDENNADKKQAVYDELISTLHGLYNKSLYIVANKSGQEYAFEGEFTLEEFKHYAVFSRENPDDKWIFNLMASPFEYNLNVDIDKDLQRKRVWLNHKVIKDGETVGIICSGMELSKTAERAISQYNNKETRVLIIDENGVIQMDSALLGDDGFLIFGSARTLDGEINSIEFNAVAEAHLDGINEYFQEMSIKPKIARLSSGRYRYAAITSIGKTNWSVVKFFDSSSLFAQTKLLPPFVIMAAFFIIFVLTSNNLIQGLLFTPLGMLAGSLLGMRENNKQNLYGTERSDEIGLLSNTIQDLFIKGHYDGLTGIYNRRYLETTVQQIMSALSRVRSSMSVMMIDVDFFKKFNDTYGHIEGDECLKTIAVTLSKIATRNADFVARYGGEEFIAVLPGTDEQGARFIADRMLGAIRDLKIPHAENVGKIVTISIGISTGDYTHTQNWANYQKKADEALYMSKNNGRNRYTFLPL